MSESGSFESADGCLGSGSCSLSVTGEPDLPAGQIMHDNLNLGSLGNLRNSKETLGSLGRFQRMMPPPAPPQYLQPTITGTIVVLVLPAGVVVIKVLAVQSVFVAICVVKSGGGVDIVDAILEVPDEEEEPCECTKLVSWEDDVAVNKLELPIGYGGLIPVSLDLL